MDTLAGSRLFAHVPDMEPVELLIERDHAYKEKGKDPFTGKKRIGCAAVMGDGVRCNRARLHPMHLGAPPSMNVGGSGLDRMAFQALKGAWQKAFTAALIASPAREWPRPVAAITVEAQIGFHTRQPRDEGNLRWMVEKAMGDALVDGGWLVSDSFFPERRYSFGGMTGVYTPGRSFTRLMLFPSPPDLTGRV